MLYPSGRQVKMAFIHTAAKPPRDVRIQQELHGTAVQQPPQLGPRLVLHFIREEEANDLILKRRFAVPDHGPTGSEMHLSQTVYCSY